MRRKGVDLQTLAIIGLVLVVVGGAVNLILQSDVIDSVDERSSMTQDQIEDATDAVRKSDGEGDSSNGDTSIEGWEQRASMAMTITSNAGAVINTVINGNLYSFQR